MSARKLTAVPATRAKGLTVEDLDKLCGYSGSIQGTPLEDALDEQRESLWDAKALLETLSLALVQHFGMEGAWPASVPEYQRVLDRARNIVNDISASLEAAVLEDRALAIARAEKAAAQEARS